MVAPPCGWSSDRWRLAVASLARPGHRSRRRYHAAVAVEGSARWMVGKGMTWHGKCRYGKRVRLQGKMKIYYIIYYVINNIYIYICAYVCVIYLLDKVFFCDYSLIIAFESGTFSWVGLWSTVLCVARKMVECAALVAQPLTSNSHVLWDHCQWWLRDRLCTCDLLIQHRVLDIPPLPVKCIVYDITFCYWSCKQMW